MSPRNEKNIVLIGMPGAGKSTIGIILAKQTSRNYVDTDVLIQVEENRSLQDIMDTEGYMALRKIEERVLLSTDYTKHVIATGGSAPYSDPAMQHLKKKGMVVFLKVSIETLKKRIRNFDTRGIALKPGQSFSDLFQERQVLYEKYADLIIDGEGTSQEAIGVEIIRCLGE